MKLNRKHIHALDIGIHKMLTARDKCYNVDEKEMLTTNVNRLRQLRILMIEAFVQPDFNFQLMFHIGIDESCSLVKGIRLLTNDPLPDDTDCPGNNGEKTSKTKT